MLYGQRPSDLTVTQTSITWAAISIRMIRPLKPSAYWLQRPAANNKTYWGRQSATLWRSMMRELNSGHDKTHPRSHAGTRSEEHTSELQSLMRISYAVFCLKKKKKKTQTHQITKDTITHRRHE